jgi:hypothetical protein
MAENFALANDMLAVWGVARDGVIVSMCMQLLAPASALSDDARRSALSVLSALCDNGLRLRCDGGPVWDCHANEDDIRRWLGLSPLPTIEGTWLIVRDALARGEKPRPEILSLAMAAEDAEVRLEPLAAGATLRDGRVADADLPRVPAGTRDPAEVRAFAMNFDGYAMIGTPGAALQFGNACLRRFGRHGVVPRTVAGARLCLFIEVRRSVHAACDFGGIWPCIDALLAVIARGRK